MRGNREPFVRPFHPRCPTSVKVEGERGEPTPKVEAAAAGVAGARTANKLGHARACVGVFFFSYRLIF